jgi:hypothetical protein
MPNKPRPPILPGPSGINDAVDCDQLRQDIDRAQAIVDSLNRALASADPGQKAKIASDLAVAASVLEATWANYSRHCLHAPIPHKPFQTSPWELVSPTGIDVGNNIWHTGSIWAVCPLADDKVLIAAETGGLWLSEPTNSGQYTSRCLSDSWPHARFLYCLADPAQPDRVFVRCTRGVNAPAGIYIGHPLASYPDWVFVPLPEAISPTAPVPASQHGGGGVSMIIIPSQRLLVAAAEKGIGWTQIDAFPFVWQTDPTVVLDLTNLPGTAIVFIKVENTTIIPKPPSLNTGQITGATFTSSLIPASAIAWKQNANATAFYPQRIASCKTLPQNVYCLGKAEQGGSDNLFVIRSDDGGATWTECQYTTNVPQALDDVLDFEDSEVKSPSSITVHPTLPQKVAVGYGGAAYSENSGENWTILNNESGWHSDIHELFFDEGVLWVPGDGGILRFGPPHFVDWRRNATLPIVMLYQPEGGADTLPGAQPRDFMGNLAAGAGLIAAGSQDNSNLWLERSAPVWQQFGGGDGGAVAIREVDGQVSLLYSKGFNKEPVKWAVRLAAGGWDSKGVVGIPLGPTAIDKTGKRPIYFRTVSPNVGLVAGSSAAAVLALATPLDSLRVVLGAVFNSRRNEMEWIELGQVPPGEVVSALEPHNSTSVLVGTKSGRLFLLTTAGARSELTFDVQPAAIQGIASDGTTIACFDKSRFPGLDGASMSYLYLGQIATPPLARLSTTQFPPNTNGSLIGAICANRNQNYLRFTFALTVLENQVWVSNSPLGVLWHKAVNGLPAAVMCSDILFAETASSGELLLSSYGRGVWRLPF